MNCEKVYLCVGAAADSKKFHTIQTISDVMYSDLYNL